jgi:hypothetical protein
VPRCGWSGTICAARCVGADKASLSGYRAIGLLGE